VDAVITLLPGDGIGPEVTASARAVLTAAAAHGGHGFDFEEALIGGAAIDATGEPLPAATIAACEQANAVFLGAVGGPKWSDPNAPVRPEQGLLQIRARLGLYANLRPVRVFPELAGASPLRAERLEGVDFIVVRELTGGIYFGDKQRDATSASDVCRYTVAEIERVVRVAADLARSRKGRLCSVDKANVLETSRLWRETVDKVTGDEYPELRVEHVLVDAMAIHLIRRPSDFDVIVTENLFGDILSDEASVLAGSVGMLPSASLGAGSPGLFEPVHGSAPGLVGQGSANPYAAILSVALLLRHGLDLEAEASAVELAVDAAIESGARTADIAATTLDAVSTESVGDAVLRSLEGALSTAPP